MNNKSVNPIITGSTKQEIWITGPTTPFFKDFVEIKELGHGQYGAVYECIRKSDGKAFAVKYLNKNRFCEKAKYIDLYFERIRDEINILKRLNHENIIKLESIYEDNKMIYIVMERCNGGELFERISKRRRYSENDAKCIIKQLLLTLTYLHDDKGIIHCDLKPENILFLNKNEDSSIKLIDFGMSKYLPRLQHATAHCGTPYYTAPEIIENKRYNHSCDMWSLGIILYVMIYGYPPFYVEPNKYKDNKQERDALYAKIIKGFDAKIKNTNKYGYGPWFPHHIKTSQELKDLINKLLTKKISNRYTANEALTHSWFKNSNQNMIDSIIMSRLIKFNKKCKFKLIISTIFRNEFITKRYENYMDLQQLFSKYDTEKNGVLSLKEFKNMMNTINKNKYIYINNKYINKIYQQLTTSPIGITFNDLLNALVYDYLISSDQRLLNAFKKLNDNNKGQITMERLSHLLQQIDPSKQWQQEIKLIKQQCIDPDGGIFWDEFTFQLHPNYELKPEWMQDLFTNNNNKQLKNNGNEDDEVISNYPVTPILSDSHPICSYP